MEDIVDEKITIETVTTSSVIDNTINKTYPSKGLKVEGLALIIKQKKKPCAGCDGTCCTKPAKGKDNEPNHNC